MTNFYKDPQLKEPEKEITMCHKTDIVDFSFKKNVTEKNRYSKNEMFYEYCYVKSRDEILDWTKCTVDELRIIIPLEKPRSPMVKQLLLAIELNTSKAFKINLNVGKNLNISVTSSEASIFDYIILYNKLIAFFSFLGITSFMREIRNNFHIHAHISVKENDDLKNRFYLHKYLSKSTCSVVYFKDFIHIMNESNWEKWLSIYSRMFHLNMNLINFAYTRLTKNDAVWNEHIWYSTVFDFFEIGLRSLIKIKNPPDSKDYRKTFSNLEKNYLLKNPSLRKNALIDLGYFDHHKLKKLGTDIPVKDDYEKIIDLSISIRNYHRHGYFEGNKESLEKWLDLYSDTSLIYLCSYLYSLIWLSLINEFESNISCNVVLQDFDSFSITQCNIYPCFIYDGETVNFWEDILN